MAMAENVRLHAIKSFYDNRLGLVTLEDDVLGIVAQVKDHYEDRVQIQLDPVSGWYHFVEIDGPETKLIFTVESLEAEDVMDRLMRSDSHSRVYEDPYLAAEREQDRLKAENDERAMEKVRDSGERLAHALKQDGAMPRLPLTVALPRGIDA